jgi:hypothetical protein
MGCLWLISSPIDEPLVKWNLTNADIQRAKNILSANQQNQGRNIKLNFTERDLNIASNYLLNSYTKSQSYLVLQEQHIHALIRFHTIQLPFFQRSFQLKFQILFPTKTSVKITKLSLGRIKIPDDYSQLLLPLALKNSPFQYYLNIIIQNLNFINIHNKQLHIDYKLPKNSLGKWHNLLLPSINLDALNAYQNQLQLSLLQHNPDLLLSIHEVLQPLFLLAEKRSKKGDPINENRFAILVANQYINHSIKFKQPYLPTYAYKRQDIAQHFMGAATLSISSNQHLAQMLSVEKELNDAKKPSGFSFVDLAADKAGIRFGSFAIASVKSARLLQKKMGRALHYKDFIPTIKDLPENLSTSNFQKDYQSIYSPQYQFMLQKIDFRIANSAIYQ